MSDDLLTQAVTQLFASYGPPGLVIGALLWVLKYLLDDRKELIAAHKVEVAAERATIEKLQAELLAEARGNADLAVSIQEALTALAKATREAA